MKKEITALCTFLVTALAFTGCGTAELEEELTKLKDENKSLKKEKDGTAKELETTKADLETAQQQAVTLQESVDDLTRKLTGLNGDIEFFTNQSAELEQEKTDIQGKLDESRAKVADLEQQLEAAKAAASAPPPATTVAVSPPPASTFSPETNTLLATAGTPNGGNPVPATQPPVAPAPPPVAPAPTEISPDNPIVNPDASSQATLAINLFISAGGNNYPLANTEIYVTELQPSITKWGLHLKNPSISANELATIQQSLASSTIHKKVITDASGAANISMLKAGTYWVSCANPATPTGLQWSVQHSVSPGANQLVLSNGNRAP
jgi:TolA-binding protein